jgi:DNA recombination protein Rad52
MSFTDTQMRQLRAKLDAAKVRTREENGATLHYVEGWHVLDEANRIFGFDGWDRQTRKTRCVWTGMSGKQYATAYTAHVRVTVRAGEVLVVREGFGAGKGRAATPGEAHEMALKCAETDATKRALATFGNRFGLALYDPEHAGVRQPKTEGDPMSWTLKTASGEPNAAFEKPTEFAVALRKAMSEAPDIERLFALWEQNVDAVRCLNKTLDQRHLKNSGVASQLVEHLKRCAVDLATPCKGSEENVQPTRPSNNAASRPKVDKSALAISEPKRIRCKQHLRFVAREPCVICGRQPTHAHHLRHAQPRGLGLKVSDEFTVPLCAIHHNDVHRVGMEETWWRERNIEPLEIAKKLWQQSLGRGSPAIGDAAEDVSETRETLTKPGS